MDNMTISNRDSYAGPGYASGPYAGRTGLVPATTAGQTAEGSPKVTPDKSQKGREKQKAGRDPGRQECQTCKERKYQDGSDESVSFKSAAHIAPQAAASAVRAHEQEHVSNAYAKAETGNGKVLNASVTLHTAVCPECGRTYISGGTTHTQIKYYNEENPYQQDLKSADRARYAGMHVNASL